MWIQGECIMLCARRTCCQHGGEAVHAVGDLLQAVRPVVHRIHG